MVHGISAAVFFFGTFSYLCIHCWLDHRAVGGGISGSGSGCAWSKRVCPLLDAVKCLIIDACWQ